MTRGRLTDALLGATALAMLAAAALFAWAGAPAGLCWFHESTGLACPFCGMTRSFVALASGDLGGAFAHHPAGPPLALALLITAVAVIVLAARRALPLTRRPRAVRALEAVAIIAVLVGAARAIWSLS